MRSIVVLVCLVLFADVAGADRTFDVRGVAMLRPARCCGGAMPNPDGSCDREEPFDGVQLTVRRGRVNRGRVVARMRTRYDGSFEARLPRGTYCLVGPDKARPVAPPGSRRTNRRDPDCMLRYLQTCDAIVRVSADTTTRVLVVQPCAHHCSGSLPR